MNWRVIHGDVLDGLRSLEAESVQCVVTSPPYWGLRDYGVDGQIGLEKTPEEWVDKMVAVFREVRRVLRKDGTVWLNVGDGYVGAGHGPGGKGDEHGQRVRRPTPAKGTNLKPKNLMMMPARLALALQADGWWLRSDIIWAKPNPTPESVTDRPTSSHEHVFLLAKAARYFYDADAVRETLVGTIHKPGNNFHPDKVRGPNARGGHSQWEDTKDRAWGNPAGRNLRNVWTIPTQPYPEAHFATYPERLVEPCIKAGSKLDDTVLDPFCGSGTTGVVALKLGRAFIGIELKEEYVRLAEKRIGRAMPLFANADLGWRGSDGRER